MKTFFAAAAALLFATTLAATIIAEHFEPNVVRFGQGSPVKVVLHTDGMVPKYRIQCKSGAVIPMASADGKLFTASVPAADVLFGYQPTGANRHYIGTVFALDAAGNPIADMPGKNLFILVRDDHIPIVLISDLPNRVRATPHVVNVAIGTTATRPFLNGVTNRFYAHFAGDDYDFIDAVYSNPSWIENRYYSGARPPAKGIGIDQMPNVTQTFGSAGKLIGVIAFPIQTFFDAGDTAQSHEIGHAYINHLKGVEGVPHWPLSTLARGVMGFSIPGEGAGGTFPFVFEQTPGGLKFKFQAVDEEFTDLDLYLMGFLPPASVGTHQVLAQQTGQTLCDGCPIAGSTVPLTVNQVIQANGPRVPSSANAQKSFRLGTVVLSQLGPLSDDEMLVLDYFAARGEATQPVPTVFSGATSKPFALATKGLGKLQTALVWPSKFPTITFVQPKQVKAMTGGTVTINGIGFTSDAKVSVINGPGITPVPTTFVNSTKLTFKMPAGAAGKRTLLVKQTIGSVKLIDAASLIP